MITLELPEAQRELPALASKALQGEQVFITVGNKTLQLSPTTGTDASEPRTSRPGRGTWKGRVTVPDSFYEPWTAEEQGERES